MSEAAAQISNTTQRQNMGQAPDDGGPRNQRQTVIASASVPVTTELGREEGEGEERERKKERKQGATINKIKGGTQATRISHLEP